MKSMLIGWSVRLLGPALLVLWLGFDYQGAGNVYVFYTCVITAITAVLFMITVALAINGKPMPPIERKQRWLLRLLLASEVLVLLWFGHFALAVMWTLSWVATFASFLLRGLDNGSLPSST